MINGVNNDNNGVKDNVMTRCGKEYGQLKQEKRSVINHSFIHCQK
jgi:hypothetical protein